MEKTSTKIIHEIENIIEVFDQERKNYSNLILNKVLETNNSSNLKELSQTECHIIAYIALESQINAITIAERMKMTRGGISKSLVTLEDKGLLVPYQLEGNNKKKYYKLTELGQFINEKHLEWHHNQEKKLIHCINQFSQWEQEIILKFFKSLYSKSL